MKMNRIRNRSEARIGKKVRSEKQLDQIDRTLGRASKLKDRGRLDEALDELGRLREKQERTERELAWFLNLEGQILMEQQRIAKASEAYLKMQDIGFRIEDAQIIGSAHFALGALEQMRGDTKAARSRYRSALPLLKESRDFRSISQIILNWGGLDVEDGDLKGARNSFKTVRELLSLHSDPLLKATFYGLLGRLSLKEGNSLDAIKEYKRSLFQARIIGSPILALRPIQQLASLYLGLRKYELALRWYRLGIRTGERAGLIRQVAEMHRGLAYAEYELGNAAGAIEHLSKSAQGSRGGGGFDIL